MKIEGPLGSRTILIDYSTGSGQMRLSGRSGRRFLAAQQAVLQLGAAAARRLYRYLGGFLVYSPSARPIPPDFEFEVSLARLITKAKKSTSARREVLDGVDTVRLDHVTLDGKGNGFQIWLDVNANYLFRRIVQLVPTGHGTRISEFWNMSSRNPGSFVPVAGKNLPKAYRSVFTLLRHPRHSDPVPESLFSTSLPQGTRVLDHSERKVYEVGPGGRPETVVGRVIRQTPDRFPWMQPPSRQQHLCPPTTQRPGLGPESRSRPRSVLHWWVVWSGTGGASPRELFSCKLFLRGSPSMSGRLWIVGAAFAVVAALGAAWWQSGTAPAGDLNSDLPPVVDCPWEIDFGTAEINRLVTAVLPITNTGGQPLTIREITTSCGCLGVHLLPGRENMGPCQQPSPSLPEQVSRLAFSIYSYWCSRREEQAHGPVQRTDA